MRSFMLVILCGLFIFSFFFNILGLLRLMPIYITSPLLFLSVYLLLSYVSGKKKFRGFR